MALNTGKILMRRGQEANFDPSKMMPGEWAVSLDSRYVRMCFSPGVCVRMATYEAFEADMGQIRQILAECQTVEEAVQRIYEDIKDVAVDVERIELAAENALRSEEVASNSADVAIAAAEAAIKKAEEAADSESTASEKAQEAVDAAGAATQKASEAAESADNVRNMSEVSQSYAVGGTGTREGEDTDNAKYYNQQASDNADRAEAAAERAAAVADVGVATTEKAGIVKPDGTTVTVDPDGTIHVKEGTKNYNDLENKPQIGGVELLGDQTPDELGLVGKTDFEEFSNQTTEAVENLGTGLERTTFKVDTIIEKADLGIKETVRGERIYLDDSADAKVVEFGLYGKAVQNGAPAPENPVDIEIAGESGSVEVKSVGKNLLENTATSQTISGVTFTVNGDGTVTINGTATANCRLILSEKNMILDNTVASCTGIAGLKKIYFAINNSETTFNVYDSVREAELSGKMAYARLYIDSGGTFNNAVIKPMIRLASDTDSTYEPYKETISTIPTENGLAGIPVDSGGNYTDQNGQQWICDEVVKYEDGSGEKIRRVGIIDSYSAETITGVYMSTTGELTAGARVIYQMSEPVITPITAEQLAEIEKLYTFYPVTNISNDFDAGMKVKYKADAKSYIDNRLLLIEQAILNSI